MKRRKKRNTIGSPSICVDCKNCSSGECVWAYKLKPVDGWKAEKILKYIQGVNKYVETYRVIECPNFNERI